MYDWGYGGHWSMGFGWIFMVLFWILLIVGTVALVKWIFSATPGQGAPLAPARRDALEILRERYARGEIDREEYEERKRVLDA